MMRKPYHKILFMFLIFNLMGFLTPTAFAETIKIGVLFHMTGDLSDFGKMQRNAFMLAFEEYKSRIPKGTTVKLIFEDMPTAPEEVPAIMENLISKQDVKFIVGGISSLVAWETASIAQAKKIPFLMSSATEDTITEQGWEYVFRLNPPFSEYGNGLLWFLSEVVKPKTIAILRARGFTGMLDSETMIDSCKKAGYEIILDYIYDEKETDFSPMLKLVDEKKPDVIAMASYLNDAVNIIKQCKEMKITPQVFAGFGGGFSLPQFGEKTSSAGNYIFSVSVWNPSVPFAGSKEFYENYLTKFKTQPNFHGSEAYAAMQVISDVLGRVNTLSPKAIREALAQTNMQSIIGPIKFVSYGRKTQQNRLPTYLIQWVDGEMKTVWPPRLACEKYVFPFPGWKE